MRVGARCSIDAGRTRDFVSRDVDLGPTWRLARENYREKSHPGRCGLDRHPHTQCEPGDSKGEHERLHGVESRQRQAFQRIMLKTPSPPVNKARRVRAFSLGSLLMHTPPRRSMRHRWQVFSSFMLWIKAPSHVKTKTRTLNLHSARSVACQRAASSRYEGLISR